MTGFGEARCQQDGLAVGVELRTVNSRFLKLTVRAGEGYSSLEPKIERFVRDRIRRGTIQVNVRVERAVTADDYRINAEVVDQYRRQLEELHQRWEMAGEVYLEALLLLPGVVDEATSDRGDVEAEWPLIRETLDSAMKNLATMRAEEGRAMAADLMANTAAATASLDQIEQRAPLVVDDYRARMEERIGKILAEREITLEPSDLIREIGVFAERTDISEEIVRLRSHIEQFEAMLDSKDPSGKKLEFLTQEMFREANTIGSKGNDVEIARQVIEVKAAIERIREMIQNIE